MVEGISEEDSKGESQKDGKNTLKKRVVVNIKELCIEEREVHLKKRLLRLFNH